MTPYGRACTHKSSQGPWVWSIARAEHISGHKSMQIYRHTPAFPAQSIVRFLRLVPPPQCGQVWCGLFLIYSAACSKKEMNMKEIYVKC